MSLAPRPGSTGPTITLSWRNFYSVLIALIPVMMVYKFPILDKGLSTVLIIVLIPFPLLYIFNNKNIINAIPFIIFFVYLMLRSKGDIQNLIVLFLVAVHVVGAFNDSLNLQAFKKTVVLVAMISTFFVLLQTLLYYMFDVKLNLLVDDFLLNVKSNAMYNKPTDLFRPSALFLEPSHYAEYCSVALLLSVFYLEGNKINYLKVIWIAFGILLSTSAAGIGLIFIIALSYFILRGNSSNKLLSLLIFFSLFLILYFILMQFSFFSGALSRLTNGEAVTGRTMFWDTMMDSIPSSKRLFGLGSQIEVKYFTTGLMYLILHYGYLGVVLLGFALTCLNIYAKNLITLISTFMFIALLIFGNSFSINSMTFWFTFLICTSRTHYTIKFKSDVN